VKGILRRRRSGLALLVAVVLAFPLPTAAQRISLIRDAETENTIREYATPIFRSAGLSADDVDIFIVRDSRLNAFVAGGQKMFMNTGLILRTETASQVIGVIAHETGHIAGGHLARIQDELKGATAIQVLSMVLGAAAAVAGKGDAGMAIVGTGTSLATSNILSFSRAQESAADQAGITFLERSGHSAKGMLEFLEILSGQELLSEARQSPYVRTHPMTRERVDAIRASLTTAKHANAELPAEFTRMHRRVKAKLFAFIEQPARTFQTYKESDTSEASRYARAVAYYRIPDMAKALPLIDGLIAEFPGDPYYWEMKGQMLFENGRVAEAAKIYAEAVRLLPTAPLIRVGYAQAQLELDRPELTRDALTHLNAAVHADRDNGLAWRLLAIAHGREGRVGEAALALAEQAMVENRLPDATQQAVRAQRLLPEGSPSWLRAQDIKIEADAKRRRESK
jgi:predicted Zn-dependent protease